MRNDRNILCFGFLLFYLFFVFPLIICSIFDYKYNSFIMANEAMKDIWANIYYAIFVILVSLLLCIFTNKKTLNRSKSKKYVSRNISLLAFWFIVIVFLIILIRNGISILLDGYGARLNNTTYEIYEPLVSVSMLFYLILIHYTKKMGLRKIIGTIVIVLLIYIHGKRFIAAQFLILIAFDLFYSKKVNGRTFVALISLCAILIIGLAYLYGVLLKKNTSSLVDYFLIDMSRHYTLIYQFFCKSSEKLISINNYDAIVADLFIFIPRNIWETKVYPFSNSITRSLLGLSPSNENLGWSTTITIFSDFYDSFGFLGLIMTIILFLIICFLINKSKNITIRILGIYFVMNFMTVQFSAYAIPCLIYVVTVLVYSAFFKKRIIRNGDINFYEGKKITISQERKIC